MHISSTFSKEVNRIWTEKGKKKGKGPREPRNWVKISVIKMFRI